MSELGKYLSATIAVILFLGLLAVLSQLVPALVDRVVPL